MNRTIIYFLIIRIFAYVVISASYMKHGINLGLLLMLFAIIEIQVWITYFSRKKEIKKLLEDTEKLKNRK